MATTTDIVRKAGDNWEAQLASRTPADREAIQGMAQATIAAGVNAADTPLALIYAAASLAHTLGLRAELGHVLIYGRGTGGQSQRRPYITEAGVQAWASQFDSYQGAEWRVLDDEERRLMLIKQPLAVEVLGWRSDWKVPARAIAYADPNASGQAVENNDPLAMALARGHRRMLLRLYPQSAALIADLERRAVAGLGESRPSVDAVPAPNEATDEWRAFWVKVQGDADWHDQSRQDIRDVISGRLRVELPRTPADADGIYGTTFVDSGITPHSAWAALHADSSLTAADPDAARMPEERLFGGHSASEVEVADEPPTNGSATEAGETAPRGPGAHFIGWQSRIESATLKRLQNMRVKIVVDHEAGRLDDEERAALESLIDERVAT